MVDGDTMTARALHRTIGDRQTFTTIDEVMAFGHHLRGELVVAGASQNVILAVLIQTIRFMRAQPDPTMTAAHRDALIVATATGFGYDAALEADGAITFRLAVVN